MKLLFKVFILIFLSPAFVKAQGRSFIKTYTPKEYDAHAQNWCITQDNAGLIYIGNTIGLLVCDGENWKSIKLNNSAVKSLARDKHDKIYYGAQDEFGYLEADGKGNFKGKSLVHLLPDTLKIFGDVWKTYCYSNKVIFQTFDFIFVYEDEKITVIEAENYFHFGYQRGEDFFIIDREIGLKKLVGNQLQTIEGGDFFAKMRIYGWINYKDYALVVTRENGLIKINFNSPGSIECEAVKTEIDHLLLSGEIYCTTLLSSGNIGIGTLLNGYFILDVNRKLLQRYNKTNGLKCDIIISSFEDKQHALWLALDIGIARIEINSRFQFFGEDDGLEGSVNSLIKFNGNIYVATTKGLYKIASKEINKLDEINGDVRDLAIIGSNNTTSILAVSEIGTFRLNSQNKFIKINDENGFSIKKSEFIPSRIYIGTNEGLLILNSNDGTLEKNKKYTFGEVRRIVEENEHTICGGTAYNGVFRIKNISSEHEQINTMDTSNGLPSLGYNLPFKVNGSFLFGTQKGIYEYDKAFNKFIPTSDFAKNYFDSNDQIYQIIEGFNDNIWLFKTNSKLHEFFLYNVKIKKATFPLRRMGEYDAYLCIFPENENVTWFGGPDGLFRYDASMPSFDTLSYHTKIRAVYCNNDTLFGGYWGFDENGKKIYTQPAIAVPEMVYKNNNINFEFAALSFDNEKENLYSYYLEGFDGGWSDWTSESKKSYTNLNEGTYTFHVKSKNVYGKVGEEDTYTFTILPPWYRTSSAYLIYAIGAVMMVYVITQLSTRRLKRAKEKLEAIVISRTAEVVAEKEEVEKQKKIVEVKNKDITDSINYAQKIQQAILPLHDEFSKVFPQSFIYFQPRDIVSGDFYWFYPPHKMDQNCVYLAAADCTGHGVPGAFMSMIGNTLLNEILNEKQIYECDAILNQLHTEVRSALKQDIAQNTTNDGMDIALCRVHLDTLELQYAGANRALYIFRPKTSGYEFIEIKPNKFPIGGFQAETTRQFTAHTLQLKQGDTLYMFSDGYADQFGGANNKKFMVKRLQAELMGMQHLPLHDQKVLIAKLLNDWKGSTEQVDDILMIGVRV